MKAKIFLPILVVGALIGLVGFMDMGANVHTAQAQVATGTATLVITKNVVNDATTTFVPSDFFVGVGIVTGTEMATTSMRGSAAGTAVTIEAPSTYAVVEAFVSGVTATYSANCAGTIQPNQTVNCTITNTVQAAAQIDFCPNLDGLQGSVPAGMIINSLGNCVFSVNMPDTGAGNPLVPIAMAAVLLSGTGLFLVRKMA